MRKIIIAASLAAACIATAVAAGTAKHPHPVDFSFKGVFGTFDRNQLKRGFQVYKEVCSACHGLKLVAFRNLKDEGGPEFTEAEAKALAASVEVPSLDETGQPSTRPGTLADHFPSPYPNEIAAKAANNGAVPPDLSLIAKGREGGADYIHAILIGYDEKPEGEHHEVPEGTHYNPYMAGGVIAMPKPISDDQVDYAEEGVPQTVDQYGKDVAAFLTWAAEPKLEARKRMGMGVIIFLSILSVLLFLSYRRVWRNVDH
ncbi:MAG: cytochrome c1 [Micropepsaceae bacterium]